MNLVNKGTFITSVVIANSCCLFMLYTNIMEAWHRSHGERTVFQCLAWLDDRQAAYYTGGWALIFLAAFCSLMYTQVLGKRKAAIILSLITIVISCIAVYTDRLFYYDI